MSAKFLSTAHGVPWKTIFLCVSALIMIHYMLVDFEPSREKHASPSPKPATNDEIADADTTPGRKVGPAGTFEDFKAMFGLSESTAMKEGHRMKKLPAGSALAHPYSRDDEYVAFCMSVKDQRLDLPEFFIHHYHHLGIKRFYIMDDGSNPPLSEMPDLGIPREHVTFEYFDRADHRPDMQDYLYTLCVEKYRSNHTWMAFLDADEYLEMKGAETLNQFLEEYEKDTHVGAVVVSWQTHSSAGVLKRPKSCRKAYIDCIWDGDGHNIMFKSIARLSLIDRTYRVHQIHSLDGAVAVDEHGEQIPGHLRIPPTKDRIALHHYALKSREEYQQKCDRGNGMDDPKDWTFWDSVEGMAGVECTSMTEYDP
ncbi:hypothetical protein CJF31_00004844 [Rutstroemia sp. NJR-2017a BVV2]|nr:hypothetical protein CJF31_00004844 [Rutstroemia sp. NJR-2017a BVV2]